MELLHIYDLGKTKIGGISKRKDYHVKSTLTTGDKTLSIKIPSYVTIEPEWYIRTKADEFVVKEIQDEGQWKSIKAVLNVEEIEGKAIEEFDSTEQGIKEFLNFLLIGTGWRVGVAEIAKKRTIRGTNTSAWELLEQAVKTYRCEITFDSINKIVNAYEKTGSDKGTYLYDKLNLKELSTQITTYDYATEIIPIGKDGMHLPEGSIKNNNYSSKKISIIWKDERYTNEADLREDAAAKLAEISKPYTAYSANVFDLAKSSDIYKNILAYKLGDTVTIIRGKLKEKQRIVSIDEYPDECQKNTCELSSLLLTFEQIQKQQEQTEQTVNNITSDAGTISVSAIENVLERVKAFKLIAQNIEAVNISVGTLEASYAEFTELNAELIEAARAEIGDLEVLIGNINTLLSGTVVAGSAQTIVLTAQNATLDDALIKNGIAAKMSIGDLQAGKISTSRFEIGSDDNTVKITDSTMQINDGGQVRVQIGKDASGDHNIYVWDKDGKLLFDAGGLTKAGADRPIITDMSVADDANISGGKLDINSVVEEVNNSSSTIQSSHIAFDETGQTLDVAFGSVETSVEEIKKQKMYRLVISSSNGNIFKNGDIETVLAATVYAWDEDVTAELDDNQFIWTRVSNDPEEDKKWNATHFSGTKQITVTSDDVKVRATFFCDLQDTVTRQSLLN